MMTRVEAMSLRALLLLVMAITLGANILAMAQPPTSPLEPLAPEEQGLTLWETIRAGGFIMVILGVLSLVATTFIIYFFFTLRLNNEAPEDFLQKASYLLEKGDAEGCIEMCRDNPSFLARVLMAGLEVIDKGRPIVQEVMQSEGARQASFLWKRIAILNDIAVLSPMLGILGTVLGMIQAFNAVAFSAGAVKPILLAGGIAKALVTTAGGLILAIPAMSFYFFFRHRIRRIIITAEEVTSKLLELLVTQVGDKSL